ncbi:hypothetical protein L9F63_015819, partial [Diploptera punctata]
YSALVRFEIAEVLSAVCLLTGYIKRSLPLNIHIGNTVVSEVRVGCSTTLSRKNVQYSSIWRFIEE